MKYLLDWGSISPINHIRLINRVYPAKVTEKTPPRPNKLSTLVFYAMTRPEKLIKVGHYLVHKIKIDVTLSNHGRNKISIDILNALLDSCKDNLHLFSLDFLKITLLLLDDNDSPLVISGIIGAFVKFCEFNRTGISATDDATMSTINSITFRLAVLCQRRSIEESAASAAGASLTRKSVKKFEIQAAAMKGLKSVASLETFTGLGTDKRLKATWEAILFNIPQEDQVRIPTGRNNLPSHTTLFKPDLLSQDVLVFDGASALALDCLEILVSRTTATTIHLVMNPLFEHFNDAPRDNGLCMRVFEKLGTRLQPRHAILVASHMANFLQTQLKNDQSVERFLNVAPRFIAMEKLENFPLIGMTSAFLTILLRKDCSDIQKSNVFAAFDYVHNTLHFRYQIPVSVSFIVKRIIKLVAESAQETSIRDALACVGRLICSSHSSAKFEWTGDCIRDMLFLHSKTTHELKSVVLKLLLTMMKYSCGFNSSPVDDKIHDIFYAYILNTILSSKATYLEIATGLQCLKYSLTNNDLILLCTSHFLSFVPPDAPRTLATVSIVAVYATMVSDALDSEELSEISEKIKSTFNVPSEFLQEVSVDFEKDFANSNEIPPVVVVESTLVASLRQKFISTLMANAHIQKVPNAELILNRKRPPFSLEELASTPNSPTVPYSDSEASNDTKAEVLTGISTNTPRRISGPHISNSIIDFKKSLFRMDEFDAAVSVRTMSRPNSTGDVDFELASRSINMEKKRQKEFETGIDNL